ncbi:hypothetical protein [Pseudoduganella ginsengisoli]|nr:hypothetical protein [Pseudoduganella ginsengisoli]
MDLIDGMTSGTGPLACHAVKLCAMSIKPLILAAVLQPLFAIAAADVPSVAIPAQRDAEWHSYRHAYKAARFFEPYVKVRPLIQAHMQIRPNTPDESMEGLQIRLEGETVNLAIPVDALGRATLPMLKQAYDEDAVLRLNRHKGHFQFSGRYSIRERDDGVYSMANLRAACEQLLSAQRESGYRLRLIGKQCDGVKFVYPMNGPAPDVYYRDAAGKLTALPAEPGYPFENATMGHYRLAVVRFAAWPADGGIVAKSRPLGIGTVYD